MRDGVEWWCDRIDVLRPAPDDVADRSGRGAPNRDGQTEEDENGDRDPRAKPGRQRRKECRRGHRDERLRPQRAREGPPGEGDGRHG